MRLSQFYVRFPYVPPLDAIHAKVIVTPLPVIHPVLVFERAFLAYPFSAISASYPVSDSEDVMASFY